MLLLSAILSALLICSVSGCSAPESEASPAVDEPIYTGMNTTKEIASDFAPPEKKKTFKQHTYTPDSLNPPRIIFSDEPLLMSRNNNTFWYSVGDTLHPGDTIETGSRQFAMISFDEASTFIIHPSSLIEYDTSGTMLRIHSATMHVDQYSESALPLIKCFDDTLTQRKKDTGENISFGIQCRGESGITISSRRGFLQWSCSGLPCEIASGKGLVGPVSSTGFDFVDIPEPPVIRHQKDSVYAFQADSTVNAYFHWTPVSLADRYLVHIFRYPEEHTDASLQQKHHKSLKIIHRNSIEITGLHSGDYFIRVMAIDFYGVSGMWSEPLPFEL